MTGARISDLTDHGPADRRRDARRHDEETPAPIETPEWTDRIYTGEAVEYPGIPRFVPEVFASARPLDTGRTKQFRRGLAQLDEEGVVQVLRDPDGGDNTGELVALFENQYRLQRLQNDEPDLVLRPLLTTTTDHTPSR